MTINDLIALAADWQRHGIDITDYQITTTDDEFGGYCSISDDVAIHVGARCLALHVDPIAQ